jgi:hypothetical protein
MKMTNKALANVTVVAVLMAISSQLLADASVLKQSDSPASFASSATFRTDRVTDYTTQPTVPTSNKTYQTGLRVNYRQAKHPAKGLTLVENGLTLGGDSLSPAKKLAFSVQHPRFGQSVLLQLEGINGLSTSQAHATHTAVSHYVSAPAVIKVNGHKIATITNNTADTIAIEVPSTILKANGFNTLQVEAGHYFDETQALRYNELSIGKVAVLNLL